VRVKPDFAGGYVNLSWYYSMVDRHQESLDAARRGAALDPSNQMAFTNMCRAYNDLALFTQALDACGRALKLKADDPETLYYMGVAYKGLKRAAEASQAFARAASSFGGVESAEVDPLYLEGAVYSQLGRYDEAVAAYRRAIALRPNFVKARYNLGVTCLLASDRQCARAEYDTLRTLAPAKASKLAELMAEAGPRGRR
jgi:tetratricopeptide (TPR) repeat protein